MHSSGSFFSLTIDEYARAIQKYPELDTRNDVFFEAKSASAMLHVGGDFYFDNQNILNQFERLFKLVSFKRDYANHDFVFLVDNARTHTKADSILHDFGMRPETRYPIDHIDYVNEQKEKGRCNEQFGSCY
jgi:hypothetical protein